MKSIGYCRVSTSGQSEDGISLEMQQSRIGAWSLANGYEQTGVYVETMSGGRASNRPELQKALAAACKQRAVLVVYSLSRLARSVKDTLLISEQLERAGANLASITERIDTNSALGKMVFRMLSTLNEFEKDQLSERTTSAMNHLRRSNKRISGRIPFGYDLANDGETLTFNEQEQATITEMKQLRQGGASLRVIAQRLAEMDVATKDGGKWYACSIKAILERCEKLT